MAPGTADSRAASVAVESLKYAINHVFLPPKAPQKDDASIEEELNLIASLLKSTRQFSRECSAAEPQQLWPVIAMLERLLKVKPGLDSATKGTSMKKVIQELDDGEVALFHIRAQNAGLILTCLGQEDILVEPFELLARNGDMMGCKGRLVREFPDCAATVCRKTVLDPLFLSEFVDVLRCLELQDSPQARPKSSKFDQKFDESRDTSSPLLLSSMVLATLISLGRSVTPRRVAKRSREQVSWDSTLLSWHRSPTWMLLRVAVRLVLDRNNFPSLYKAFLTFHHARLLEQAAQLGLDSDLRFAMASKFVRRIMKLSPHENLPWFRTVRNVLTANQGTLQRRWQKEQTKNTPVAIPAGRLQTLCFESDTNLRLQKLSGHLESRGKSCPLLLEYNPGFGYHGLLDPLILSTHKQMVRLVAIESYIYDRRDSAAGDYPLAFANFGRQGSFAVRYFNSSPEHQSLYEEIKGQAESNAAKKVQEYHTMRSEYAELSSRRASAPHSEKWCNRQKRMISASGCEACRLQSQMSALNINKFEPGKLQGVNRLWFAADHSGLKVYQPRTSQVQLASTVKPVEASHYRPSHINAVTEADVCVCLEAGPYTKFNLVFRQAHADLSNAKFVRNLVAALNDSLRRYCENWQNDVAVSLLICIATKVLSMATSRPLVDGLLAFLSQARVVTIKWARHLLARRANCGTEKGQEELTQRVLMVAVTCTSTFDVGSDHLEVIIHSRGDLGALVESTIMVYDHRPAEGAASTPVLTLLLQRWHRIMHRSMGFVKKEWSAQSGVQAHTLAATMVRQGGSPISITLNLLEGRLLVDGYPLSRLPDEYQSNRAYTQLFGAHVLEVMPSTRRGQRFSACRDQQGWIVHFVLTDGELVIQAVRGADASPLEGDVPASFARNYSHWMNLSTGAVEFRPVNEPWASSPDNWILTRDGGRNILSRRGQGQYLINPHSLTAEAISTYLSPIEDTSNVDMIFQSASRVLALELSRFSISFTLAEGESSIRSKHYSGMCIDECQSIGALVGLQNKLVLKREGVSASCTLQRLVLVLRETLSSRPVGYHVSVTVDQSSALHVKHDAFSVDPTLGRITSGGSLSSKLYLFIPATKFYPTHLQVMEQVNWSSELPVLAQHDGFWPAVEAILRHARDCEIFHPPDDNRGASTKFAPLERSSTLLVDRAKIRNAMFRVSEFGAEDYTTNFDRQYLGRHRKEGHVTEAFTRVKMVTKAVVSGHKQLLELPSAWAKQSILEVTGKSFPGRPQVDLSFTLDYLQPPEMCLIGLWCGLHRAPFAERNKYKIAFLAFANSPSVFQTRITPPSEDHFDLEYNVSSMRQRMDKIVEQYLHPFENCPEANIRKKSHESKSAVSQRRYLTWKSESNKTAKSFVSDLETQWRQAWTVSTLTSQDYRRYFDVDSIMAKVREALELARRTSAFERYLDSLVSELGQMSLFSWKDDQDASNSDETSTPAPSTKRPQPQNFSHLLDKVTDAAGDTNPLTGLLDRLFQLCDQKPYSSVSSVNSASPRIRLREGTSELEAAFEEYLTSCKQATSKIRRSIGDTLGGKSVAEEVGQGALLYPRISPIFLLQRLSRVFWNNLPADWRRAERLINALQRPDCRTDFLKELSNMGSHECGEGEPLVFPETVLLELEQGILIRPVQSNIAAHMRHTPGGEGMALQLNMGEGKSSVIVPMVFAALADGKRLVRVVVAKAQSNQLAHTLIATLGGLINCQVFYLPISRSLQLKSSDVEVINRMLATCRNHGLMALESTWADGNGAGALSKQIVTTYNHMEDMFRDIVDESHENFSVKFELIYTTGTQRPIDMSPDRWKLIQELMGVVLDVAEDPARRHAEADVKGLLFEGDRGSGRFPIIRVLEESASKRLVSDVAEHVCCVGLKGFPIHHQSISRRTAVVDYILQPNLSAAQIAAVQNDSSGLFSETMMKNTFRVNYGFAPDRRPPTMLAVPYRAKDSPAPRSEFSHPDVVIVLTCLSYYYQGLSNGELRTCLEKLSKSDQADQEYGRWAAASPKLPSSQSHFSGVNLRDTALCKQSVFPSLRYAKPAIDFYLSTVVFPREMREFPYKLSASGWDLEKAKRHLLTGFSGTTDSKYVLSLSVTALDLPEQRHTNATVLACLLRTENTVLELGGDQDQLSASTADMLLTAVTQTASSRPMRVVLDVGAQIVELSNYGFAQRWLELTPAGDADAVIFFNDDELAACMRMRKLGSGQSVTFCVSPEMAKRLRSFTKLEESRPLTVSDVLVWAIVETWDDAHRSIPLWAAQGIRHQQQETVWERVAKDGELSAQHVQDYLENETQSLEQRYRPESEASSSINNQSLTSKLKAATKLTSRQIQERELAPEVERERQVERPPRKQPASHNLHADVMSFAVDGVLLNNNSAKSAFMPAFQSLANTSAAALFPVKNFPSSLLVTVDFARIIRDNSSRLDAYQRPVQWILTQSCPAAAHGMRMVIVSPYEAERPKQLLLEQEPNPNSDSVLGQLRAYLPHTSMSYCSMEDLSTYVFPDAGEDAQPPPRPPPELLLQLKLFAGGLYLQNFGEYVQLALYLGLAYTPNEGERDVAQMESLGRILSAEILSPVKDFEGVCSGAGSAVVEGDEEVDGDGRD
ncbi:hypothetical protein N657DRAFT_665989 [Parathielavia appendiculata]|uniref:ubiquitinyl hydrolase 1 n=1 Tax=Parathielavia appendiculata TaxID=2587402 RepID=A0AAN6Z0M5_9PEZI|nr:hypothetical protein N657DRAFT_665989 [Parathielavia appendiculata]